MKPSSSSFSIDRRRLKIDFDAFGCEQRFVLARQARVGVGQYLFEVGKSGDQEPPLEVR
jgi:hypothetical protein